jgi:pyruvate-ferredoxin/flavodoxin oxidoreductase
LETLLLDKSNYQAMVSGDGSCMGCGEKTVIHLFTSTVAALMQGRVKRHVAELDDLINRLETHIRLKLAAKIDLTNTAAISKAVSAHKDDDLRLSDLSAELDYDQSAEPVDPEWLTWVTGLLDKLRHLKSQYTAAQPRSTMGIVNATGCSSVWGATFPFNPYPFPWSNHLFQDSPSMALGLFEGHMRKMGEGFKAIRMARLELERGYNPAEHGEALTYFGWKDFSDEEWLLCPPVVAVGGDGAMYDIGFQNLSRALMSGHPVKIMVLDTQVYSNTGGQSCTSGFIGQVADMAPYGRTAKGKTEIRKEMGLIGMAHRTSFVLNGAVGNLTHLLEGFIDGLNARHPALFNIYSGCQPEHGIGDDMSAHQSRMAIESRAYPLFRFDPDAGTSFEECCSIEGNPDIDRDWISWTLKYTDEKGEPAEMEVPFTFADFAMTEGRFRKHFRKAPPETWNDSMIPIAEFLDMDEDDRIGHFPYVWGVDGKNRLMRVLVSQELVTSCEERRSFWTQIRGICGHLNKVDVEQVRNQAKAEMAQKLTTSLLAMAGGDVGALAAFAGGGNGAGAAGGNGSGNGSGNGAATDWEPVWVETPECTACDECITINPKIFKYNGEKKVEVIDPKGGSYQDIVKAAEKCTAGCIHPGTPWNPAEAGLDKLLKRAAKYQ